MLIYSFWFVILCVLMLNGCSTHYFTEVEKECQNTVAAEANVQLALAFLQQGYTKLARQKLLLAQKLDPNDPAVWYGMGYFEEAVGEMGEARKNYEYALMLAPKDGSTRNNYGAFLVRIGEYNSAINQFLFAINDPEFLDTAAAYENAGHCALKIPNRQLAKQYFTKALAQEASSETSAFCLAQIAFEEHDYKTARHYLERLLKAAHPSPRYIQLATKVGLR